MTNRPCFAPPHGQNRQSPIASVQRTRSTLASHSAVPLWNKCSTSESQHQRAHWRRVNAGSEEFLCFGGRRYDHQRTLAIRIAAITLASDSARTIARFRPSTGPPKGYVFFWCFWGSPLVLSQNSLLRARKMNSTTKSPKQLAEKRMQLFCLQLEASCLQMELCTYNVTIIAFLLTAPILAFYLKLVLFCLQL